MYYITSETTEQDLVSLDLEAHFNVGYNERILKIYVHYMWASKKKGRDVNRIVAIWRSNKGGKCTCYKFSCM